MKVKSIAVVIPVAKFDWNLAVKMLAWWKAMLNGRPNPFPTIAWCSTDLTTEQMDALGDTGLPNLSLVTAKDVKEIGYFGTPNAMFKTAIEYVEKGLPGRAMLWVEADAVPMRPTWIEEILKEYRACGRPFLGQILRDGEITHMTGNGVYHPNWRTLAPSLAALGQESCGWDTLCAHEIVPRAHNAKTIQQIWRPGPFDAAAVKALVKPDTALFHQCKDGTLIDVLAAQRKLPAIPLEAALCKSTYEAQAPVQKYDGPVGYDSSRPVAWSPTPVVEIMIVTFGRDMDFLRYCLRSIQRYSVSFAGVTVVAPLSEKGSYSWMPHGFKIVYFDEMPGKGMLGHLMMKCRADEICPNAEAILHVDADNMFWENFTPQDYMPYNKPILVREKYAVCGLRNENRLRWRQTTINATGIDCEWETMVRHPQIHRRAVYKRLRELVEAHTKQTFQDYVLSGQNNFPQSFAEFPALGAVVCSEFADKYTMVDYDRNQDARECGVDPNTSWQYIYRQGRDKMIEFWSHGGIGMYEKQMEQIMRGNRPAFVLK